MLVRNPNRSIKKYLRLNSRGDVILNALLGIALLAIAATVVMTTINSQSRNTRFTELVSVRDFLLKYVDQYSREFSTLELSKINSANSELAKCIDGTSLCDSTAWHDLVLVDPQDTSKNISGSSASPQLYSIVGKPCGPPASKNCPFEVFTRFKSNCGTAPNCTVSMLGIFVEYTVRVAAGIDLNISPIREMKRIVLSRYEAYSLEPKDFTSCNADWIGQLRYIEATKLMFYCDGNKWVSVRDPGLINGSNCKWTPPFRRESGNSPQAAPEGCSINGVYYQSKTGGNDGVMKFEYCCPP